MSHHEQHWLIQEEMLCYFIRYMMMTFARSKHQSRQMCLNFLNTTHKNIKFTIEIEQAQKLQFLDVLITKRGINRDNKNFLKV